jgi:CheY-like chemotaxis protein
MTSNVEAPVQEVADADVDGYRLLGDQPFTGVEDALGLDEIARRLKKLILLSGASTPFTIGIEASWGRGKSSLMRRLADELGPQGDSLERATPEGRRSQVRRFGVWASSLAGTARDRVVGQVRRMHRRPAEPAEPEIRTVWFNAWTAEGGGDALEGLIKSVLQAMDPSALRRTLRRRKVLGVLRISLLFLAGWLRVGALVDAAWDRLSVDSRTRNETRGLVEETMREWLAKTGVASPRSHVVVFIDDLDRCSPANVLRVFEAIKVYLDAPGFIFVVGYDEAIVSDGIRSEKDFTEAVTGRDYIEKIVQIVFRIPHPDDVAVGKLVEGYLEESHTKGLFRKPEIHLITERNNRNPRRIKRFINRFVLEHRLDKGASALEASVLVATLMFETYFPKFARLFSEPDRKPNPLVEFDEYRTVRSLLRQGEFGRDSEATLVENVFQRYGVQPPQEGEKAQDAFRRLEQEGERLPEFFSDLSQNGDFVSLVRGFEDREKMGGEIAGWVQRRPERLVHAAGAEPPRVPGDLTGLRILWVDDKPAGNESLVRHLRDRGAEVTPVETGVEAEEAVRAGRVDLLISDIGRGDRPAAGFEDLGQLRDDGRYEGPAIFYASYVSGPRRSKAKELRASITSVPDELFRFVADVAERQRSESMKQAVPA